MTDPGNFAAGRKHLDHLNALYSLPGMYTSGILFKLQLENANFAKFSSSVGIQEINFTTCKSCMKLTRSRVRVNGGGVKFSIPMQFTYSALWGSIKPPPVPASGHN